MNYDLKGKKRWIFKFKHLNKQRILIFRLTVVLTVLITIAFIINSSFNFRNNYYLLPSLIMPIFMVYPHAINKRRLEQLYVDLPKEIKHEYEKFVKKYAKYLLIIQFVLKKQIINDEIKIIKLVNEYKA